MSGKNRLSNPAKLSGSGQISAGFGKSAGFRPELEPKSGTALVSVCLCVCSSSNCLQPEERHSSRGPRRDSGVSVIWRPVTDDVVS